MKIKEALNSKSPHHVDLFEIELLLAFSLKKSRAYLMAHREDEIPESCLEVFSGLLERRKKGEPIAYIIGKKEFWSKEFLVNADTLIPRPETELLIETVLENFDLSGQYEFLELGTGSGAIAITLSTSYTQSKILALDISENALRVAQKNKEVFQANNLTLLKSDWYSEISSPLKFDLIISNPPYLSSTDPHLKSGDLRFEPHTALEAGLSGLECLEKIAQLAPEFLKPDGMLILEHGYDQAAQVEEILKIQGFVEIRLKKDLIGLPRVTMGKNVL